MEEKNKSKRTIRFCLRQKNGKQCSKIRRGIDEISDLRRIVLKPLFRMGQEGLTVKDR